MTLRNPVNNLHLRRDFATEMDAGSIGTTVVALLNACGRIMKIMSGFNDVDDAVKMFNIDIQELSNELKGFGEELSMTGEEWQGGHWVNRSMDDCQGTLARLEQVLADVKKVDAGPPSALDLNSGEIALLHREFTAYRWVIKLSRLLIMYVS